VLAAYSLLVTASQVVWLTFAPITTQAASALGVSEGSVGILSGINPLLYALLALPLGRWTDRRFNATLCAGALLTVAGAVVRCVWPMSFAGIMAGQLLNAAGQPLILNATTKLAVRYFPPAQRTLAVSVGSAAQFAGILVASTAGNALFQTGGLRTVFAVYAVVAITATACMLAALRVRPTAPDGPVARGSLRWLRGDRVTWQLAGLLFIGMGVFNALATWLDPILNRLGYGQAASSLITLITVSGMIGAAVLPPVAAARGRRRGVLICATAVTTLVFLTLAFTHNLVLIAVALVLEGFVLLAGLPIALEWSEIHAGPDRAGAAAGFLLCAGNLGGAVLVLLLEFLIDEPTLAFGALSLIAVPGLLLVARLPATAAAQRSDTPRHALAGDLQ
jgi:predicted MFS family arabinose efflux permease